MTENFPFSTSWRNRMFVRRLYESSIIFRIYILIEIMSGGEGENCARNRRRCCWRKKSIFLIAIKNLWSVCCWCDIHSNFHERDTFPSGWHWKLNLNEPAENFFLLMTFGGGSSQGFRGYFEFCSLIIGAERSNFLILVFECGRNFEWRQLLFNFYAPWKYSKYIRIELQWAFSLGWNTSI